MLGAVITITVIISVPYYHIWITVQCSFLKRYTQFLLIVDLGILSVMPFTHDGNSYMKREVLTALVEEGRDRHQKNH